MRDAGRPSSISPDAAWLLAPFSPLLAVLPVHGPITVVKENTPKERVRVPNEQPAPCPPWLSFLAPSLLSFLPPFSLSPLLSSSPPISASVALLGPSVICQRWTLGFRDPPASGWVCGVSCFSSVLDSKLSTGKPIELLSWQLRCDSVPAGVQPCGSPNMPTPDGLPENRKRAFIERLLCAGHHVAICIHRTPLHVYKSHSGWYYPIYTWRGERYQGSKRLNHFAKTPQLIRWEHAWTPGSVWKLCLFQESSISPDGLGSGGGKEAHGSSLPLKEVTAELGSRNRPPLTAQGTCAGGLAGQGRAPPTGLFLSH